MRDRVGRVDISVPRVSEVLVPFLSAEYVECMVDSGLTVVRCFVQGGGGRHMPAGLSRECRLLTLAWFAVSFTRAVATAARGCCWWKVEGTCSDGLGWVAVGASVVDGVRGVGLLGRRAELRSDFEGYG